MKININPEKYYNNECPTITEEMLDWVFLTLWSTRYYQHRYKKIESVNIRVNQAYEGSRSLHFYVSFNDNPHEFHKEWYIGSSLEHQFPPLHKGQSWTLGINRWEWMCKAENEGIDCGVEGKAAVKRMEVIRNWYDRKDEVAKQIKRSQHNYKQYLRLKEQFESGTWDSYNITLPPAKEHYEL